MERLTRRGSHGRAYFDNDGVLIRGANGAFHQKKDMTAHYIHDRFVALDKAIDRLAAYEDALPLERAEELAQAEKDGRLAVLPDAKYTDAEGIYGLVPFEGAPRKDWLSIHFDMSPEQEKDNECPQSHLRGISWGTSGLRSSKAYGREPIKQCSVESGMGNGARKLERQETTSHSNHWGETSNVKINRCTERGDCRLIQTGDEPKEDCRDLFCEPMCYLENIKIPFIVGQILYVRETWNRLLGEWIYKADQRPGFKNPGKWHPSIHMPREAARIFLRVTDVRVERLQSITELDILEKEGVTVDFPQPKPSYASLAYAETRLKPAVRKAFADLWNACYSKPQPVKVKGVITHYESYPWEDIQETRTYRGKPWYVIGNPWVWVIEFERCEKP